MHNETERYRDTAHGLDSYWLFSFTLWYCQFNCLIHLQITACKCRSAANNSCKYFIEHVNFKNNSSALINNISLFLSNVNMMTRFAELSESELSTILEEKGVENIKKQLWILSTYSEVTSRKMD